jgi:hypothetical protein
MWTTEAIEHMAIPCGPRAAEPQQFLVIERAVCGDAKF